MKSKAYALTRQFAGNFPPQKLTNIIPPKCSVTWCDCVHNISKNRSNMMHAYFYKLYKECYDRNTTEQKPRTDGKIEWTSIKSIK